MGITITATEAARRFSDLLNRVRYRGESFTIVRSGETVATLAETAPARKITLRELVGRLVGHGSGDPDLARDLEAIQAEQGSLGEGPWASSISCRSSRSISRSRASTPGCGPT